MTPLIPGHLSRTFRIRRAFWLLLSRTYLQVLVVTSINKAVLIDGNNAQVIYPCLPSHLSHRHKPKFVAPCAFHLSTANRTTDLTKFISAGDQHRSSQLSQTRAIIPL